MRRIPLFLSILAVATTALGAHSRWTLKERSVIETAPFVVSAQFPEGWSVENGQVVPPEALRSACRVQREILHGSDWNTALAGAMRDAQLDKRELFKAGGHVAVKYETGATESVFINLDDIEPAAFAIWNVAFDQNAAGHQCRSEFDVLARTVSIEPAR